MKCNKTPLTRRGKEEGEERKFMVLFLAVINSEKIYLRLFSEIVYYEYSNIFYQDVPTIFIVAWRRQLGLSSAAASSTLSGGGRL